MKETPWSKGKLGEKRFTLPHHCSLSKDQDRKELTRGWILEAGAALKAIEECSLLDCSACFFFSPTETGILCSFGVCPGTQPTDNAGFTEIHLYLPSGAGIKGVCTTTAQLLMCFIFSRLYLFVKKKNPQNPSESIHPKRQPKRPLWSEVTVLTADYLKAYYFGINHAKPFWNIQCFTEYWPNKSQGFVNRRYKAKQDSLHLIQMLHWDDQV